MNWGRAQEVMDDGGKEARRGWNGKGLWAVKVLGHEYQVAGHGRSYLLRSWYGLKDVNDNFGPWVPSTSDLMADDWEEITDGNSHA